MNEGEAKDFLASEVRKAIQGATRHHRPRTNKTPKEKCTFRTKQELREHLAEEARFEAYSELYESQCSSSSGSGSGSGSGSE